MSTGKLRVLVPGGTGYIGGRVAEHLAAQGHDVCVCSRREAPWAGPSKSIKVQKVNWRDREQLDQLMKLCDAVVMLAATNEIESAQDPVAASESTSTQCMAWLASAARKGKKQFIYFSTIHVYGVNDGTVLSEACEPRPVHPYASTHLAGEVFVRSYHRQGKVDATIFRLSNAFGSPVDPGVNRWTLLVNDLARQAVLHGKLCLRTDGLQARDFVGINQVCAAVNWSLQSDRRRTAEASIFNLGSGVSETVYGMALRVSRRAQVLWQGEFPVLRTTPRPDATEPPFFLDVAWMKQAGLAAEGDPDREIDELLRFCKEHEKVLAHA